MISESASEPSSMSPSPPATKLTKHNHKVKSPRTTHALGILKNEHQSKIKLDHSTATTHSNAKRKSKPKHDEVNDNEDDDDNDDTDNDNGHHGNSKKRKSTNTINDSHSLNNKANKNQKHEAKHHQQKATNDSGQAISHKNKCPESGTISTCIPSSVKRMKKEKKRYQELVIDGFTITAFRTWEDLQDEINERISDNIKMSAQYDDSEMPNTSNSNTNSLTATANNSLSNQTDIPATTTSKTPPPQFKQLPSSSGLSSSSNTATELYGNPTSHHHHHHHHRSDRQDHLNQIGVRNMHDNHGGSRSNNHVELRMDYTDQQSLLPKTQRPTMDHDRRQVNHDNSNRRDKYHKSGMQSTRNQGDEETQHQSSSSVNNNHSSSTETMREQHRSSQPNELDSRTSTKTQFDPFRAAPPFQPASVNSYPRRSPSPPRAPPLPSSQAAQQYFQQYHQLYQQMHNSNHPPPPHSQNPYLALINQSHGSQYKGPPHPVQSQHPPPPPPPAMPMPGPSSMMASSHFNSPYTITDTIISRQTSIIPSSPMAPMPGSLEHLASSRYGRNPHFSALEHHHMMPPSFGQYHQSGGYLPSPTERSFMEFARSYANASNMSSSYANFINQASMPKNPVGIPNLYDRVTMDQQHRAMIQGFGSGGPGPFPSFNPVGRPPTISMFPPQFFP